MGVVDLARAPDGTDVALKRLSLHGTPDDITRARGRIRREAEVLSSLDHPGIVRLLDVVDDGDDVVLVMPFLPGGSLHERVARGGPMSPESVQVLADRLLDALAAAHRQGVVHRDIKPENVLFTADGDPRLVDFGVARSSDQTLGLTATSMVVGTPGFMAPEQARGEAATPAADVFSLGATLLFALTGSGPFGAPNADPRVLMHRAASGRVEKVPREVPAELRTLLLAMLDPRPERRPSAARLRGGPAGTRPFTELVDAVRRNRVVAAAGVGAVVLLVLVGVGAALLAGRGDDDDAAASTTTESSTSTSTTAPCEPRAYQPCQDGVLGPVAPNTDGERCLEGFADYDGDAENGCEAEADGLNDPARLTERVGSLEATIVPEDDVDVFVLPIIESSPLCTGSIAVTIDVPAGIVLQMTVERDTGEVMGDPVVEGPGTATVTVGERCVDTDGDLRVTVAPIGSDRTGEPYRISRSGTF